MAGLKEKIETFELSDKAHPYIPVSTTKILWNYTRDPPPDIPMTCSKNAVLGSSSTPRLWRSCGGGSSRGSPACSPRSFAASF